MRFFKFCAAGRCKTWFYLLFFFSEITIQHLNLGFTNYWQQSVNESPNKDKGHKAWKALVQLPITRGQYKCLVCSDYIIGDPTWGLGASTNPFPTEMMTYEWIIQVKSIWKNRWLVVVVEGTLTGTLGRLCLLQSEPSEPVNEKKNDMTSSIIVQPSKNDYV